LEKSGRKKREGQVGRGERGTQEKEGGRGKEEKNVPARFAFFF
jgi:hypothetical protein